jgi:hypothetical protein
LKVAFDEHVPIALAKVFVTLAKERPIRRVSGDLIFEKAADYAPKIGEKDYIKKGDVPWLDRFSEAGGHAVISGDTKMRERVHERLALYQHGFVVIFFEAQWGTWNFFRKTALMLHWWEPICDKIKRGERATFWAVPAAWPASGGELRNVSLGLAQLLSDRTKAEGKRNRTRRPSATKPADDRQRRLLFEPTENKRGRNKEG